MPTVKIESHDEHGVLDVSLGDLLQTIGEHGRHLDWRVYWLEGTAKPGRLDIVSLETEVRRLPSGRRFTWHELNSLASDILQMTDGLIAAFEPGVEAAERSTVENHRGATIILELDDSAYWLVTVHNDEITRNVTQAFDGAVDME